MKKLVVSPITNKIYYATVKDKGAGLYEVTGKKEDVTDWEIEEGSKEELSYLLVSP